MYSKCVSVNTYPIPLHPLDNDLLRGPGLHTSGSCESENQNQILDGLRRSS